MRKISYISNIYKTDPVIITFKLFSKKYFWLILKFIEYDHYNNIEIFSNFVII